MTRMTARQIAVQLLFSTETNKIPAEEAMELFFSGEHYSSLEGEDSIYRETPDSEQLDYIRRLTLTAQSHLKEIDEVISRYARDWKKERLSRTTLAILRCAICEILYLDDIPNSAAVNEAVELGKRYDSDQAAAFINGLLGTFLRAEMKREDRKDSGAETKPDRENETPDNREEESRTGSEDLETSDREEAN